MGLFNFSAPSNNEAGGVSDNIELIINDETITVSAAEASNMTVKQVFDRFASSSADVSRVNRYVAQGRIVAPDSIAEAGTIYSAAIASETKGADASLTAIRSAMDLLQDCGVIEEDAGDQYLSEYASETGISIDELINA